MRGSGGRTRSRGSLRGHPKAASAAGSSAAPESRTAAIVPPGAGKELPAPGRRPRGVSLRKAEATAAMVASVTSTTKHTSERPKRRCLEVFVPLQRHLHGEERILRPCGVKP